MAENTNPGVSGTQRVQSSMPTVLLILGLLLFGWFLFQIKQVLILLAFSCIIASALYPMVSRLRQRHLPRGISVLLFYLLFVLIFGGIIFLIVNVLIKEGEAFATQFPQYIESAVQFIGQLPFFAQNQELTESISQNLQNIITQIARILASAFDYIFMAFNGILSLITILVLSYYMLTDARHFEAVILRLVPGNRQETAQRFMQNSASKIGNYVRGQLIVMTVVGVAVWLGLSLIGIPYAYILGIIAFFLEIVPIIGPIIAAAIGMLVALGQDPLLAFWTALFYFLVQQVENYALVPKILGRSVELHPFWVLISVLTGATLAGVTGVLLSIPVAVIIRFLIEEFYIGEFLKSQEQNTSRPPDVAPAGE